MNVLVVGGAGYVGSHAALRLARSGHETWVYDNLVHGHRGACDSARLIEGDVLDSVALERALREHEIEAVMHFAAYTLVGESVTNPGKYYRNNVVGSLTLLETMLRCDVRKIVFSSTAAVYGDPVSVPIREDAVKLPVNPYGTTKLTIEHALADFAAAHDFGFAALRYFNAAGAHPSGEIGEDHKPESHLIPLVLQVPLGQRKAIAIFGDDYPTPDGTCVRDYIHVEDLASAHTAAVEALRPGSQIRLNLGSGEGYSVKQVIEMCREVTGHDIPAEIQPRRAGDPPSLVADPSAARAALDWSAQRSDLRTIIADAWRWHVGHPRGYDDRSS